MRLTSTNSSAGRPTLLRLVGPSAPVFLFECLVDFEDATSQLMT